MKGFDQLLNGVDQGLMPFIGILFIPDQGLMPFIGILFIPDQGLIPFIGILFIPDQGDMPPKPVIGFIPYMPLIIGRVVIPKGLAEPQPGPLLFPSMASDIAFIIISIMRNMAPKVSSVAFAGADAGTNNTTTNASMSCFFFRNVIDAKGRSHLYP